MPRRQTDRPFLDILAAPPVIRRRGGKAWVTQVPEAAARDRLDRRARQESSSAADGALVKGAYWDSEINARR
jgi:hypothetical protein